MDDRFKDWKSPDIKDGQLTKWNWLVRFPQNLHLGKNTDIGAFCYLNALHGIDIEDNAQIGSHSSIYSISTIDEKKGKVVIKEGARIGSHSVVMPGVTIGKNAVIGACSYVNKDIPDNSLAFGVPAVVIQKRQG